MKQFSLSKVLSCVMAVLFPLSMMATAPGAMVFPTGSVTVNGNELVRPAAVFSGDRIDTAQGSLSMTMTGSSVLVAPKSSVVFAPEQMTVSSGSVRIATTTGLAGRVRNLSLRPDAKSKSVYTVSEHNGKILIASLEGSLSVNDGGQQILIAANHAVSIPVQDTNPSDQPKCKKGDKACEKAVKACKGDKACEAQAVGAAGGAAAGGAAAGAAGAGAAAGASVSSAVAVGVAAAVAGVSAAASYGIAKATEQTSSASPH